MNCMEANVENFHVDLEAYKVIASITYLFGLKSNRVAYSLTLGKSLVTTLVVILQVAIFPRKRGAYISLNNEYDLKSHLKRINSNKFLKTDFGPYIDQCKGHGQLWRQDSPHLETGLSKQPPIESGAFYLRTLGKRTTIILLRNS